MTDEVIPYGRQSVDEDDIAAVVEVLRGDWLTTGPTVEAFEAALSEVTGGHPVVAVNSGTAALHCAYATAGLGPGTTLVTTPLTFVATAAMAIHLGANVVFADVDDETLCIDPESVERVITADTRVITGVDYAGHPCDWPALREIADQHGAILVDDAAHALGSKLHGRPMGDWADITTFSFHPVKTITTAEGGAVVTKRREFFENVRRFRSHGLVRDYHELRNRTEGSWHQEVHRLGFNYRMSDLNAALGLSQLNKLQQFVQRRAELRERYLEGLVGTPNLRLPYASQETGPAWHLFAIRVVAAHRNRIFGELLGAGIKAQVHYLPVYLHPALRDMVLEATPCPVSEAAYAELISIPLYPDLTLVEQDIVIETLRSSLDTSEAL